MILVQLQQGLVVINLNAPKLFVSIRLASILVYS